MPGEFCSRNVNGLCNILQSCRLNCPNINQLNNWKLYFQFLIKGYILVLIFLEHTHMQFISDLHWAFNSLFNLRTSTQSFPLHFSHRWSFVSLCWPCPIIDECCCQPKIRWDRLQLLSHHECMMSKNDLCDWTQVPVCMNMNYYILESFRLHFLGIRFTWQFLSHTCARENSLRVC